MCLLYRLDAPAAEVARIFDADPGDDPWDGGYVAPGRFAPVVIMRDRRRRIVPRLWGVPPPPRVASPVCNVRNLESPFWIGSLRHTEFRCLVPATRFMEWGGTKGARVQHWFSVPSEPVFAIAGLWRDSEMPSFAFLTCEPNSVVAAVHPRAMPVLLHKEDWDRWLTADWKEARLLADPFPSQLMIDEPVAMSAKASRAGAQTGTVSE